jgi:hypothetical protein
MAKSVRDMSPKSTVHARDNPMLKCYLAPYMNHDQCSQNISLTLATSNIFTFEDLLNHSRDEISRKIIKRRPKRHLQKIDELLDSFNLRLT